MLRKSESVEEVGIWGVEGVVMVSNMFWESLIEKVTFQREKNSKCWDRKGEVSLQSWRNNKKTNVAEQN